MVLVRRGNVELEVNEDFLSQYLAKGFDQVDDKTGEIVKKGTANNYNSLQLAYVQLNKENQSLSIENQKLKRQVEELNKKVNELNKKASTNKTTNKE